MQRQYCILRVPQRPRKLEGRYSFVPTRSWKETFFFLSYRGESRIVHTVRLEDSQNLVTCCASKFVSFSRYATFLFHRAFSLTSDDLDLSNTMAVSEDNTDLRWSGTLSGESADVLDDGLGGALEPGGHRSRVWDGRGADTLSFAVKTTHDDGCRCCLDSSVR